MTCCIGIVTIILTWLYCQCEGTPSFIYVQGAWPIRTTFIAHQQQALVAAQPDHANNHSPCQKQYQISRYICNCIKHHDAGCVSHVASHLSRLTVASWSIAKVLMSSLSIALLSVDLDCTERMQIWVSTLAAASCSSSQCTDLLCIKEDRSSTIITAGGVRPKWRQAAYFCKS